MKRIMTLVAACTLIAGACGSGDDSSESTADDTADTADETLEETVEESVDDTADTADDPDPTPADDATSADEDTGGDEPVDAGGDDTSVDEAANDDDGGPSIRSLDDIPQVCRDEMAKFLRTIEPMVSEIDWETATFADFERIATEFEAESEEFDAATETAGCDELDFLDDSEGELLIEFARQEAPGAVGFLEYIELLSTSTTPGDGDAAGDSELETCQDAIDFLQGLMDDYGTITAVPASELLKITSIATITAECSPEQMAFFDDPDLQEFMGG